MTKIGIQNPKLIVTNDYQHTVFLKGKYRKKNVSDNPSMDSSTKIYIDSEKLWPKIREWDLFELTLKKMQKKP